MAASRQAQIRETLRREYSQRACNEGLVAKLRYEMAGLPHRHAWIDSLGSKGSRECKFCWAGTDFYFMSLSEILVAVASW